MASLAWITPLQCVAALDQAVNFGASGFQTPLTMPVLRNDKVPSVHAGTLVVDLLHRSEMVFPPLNAVSTISNLAMAIALYLNRGSAEAKAKLPWVLASFACSVGVTVYALTVMVPINNAMKESSKKLQKDADDKEASETFRKAQATWTTFNMGRASLMLSSAVTAMVGVLAH